MIKPLAYSYANCVIYGKIECDRLQKIGDEVQKSAFLLFDEIKRLVDIAMARLKKK